MKLTQLTHVTRVGERPFVYSSLKGVFERHHQLDALQRAQPQLLERRLRRQIGPACVLRHQGGERVGAGLHGARRRGAALRPLANRRAFQLACAFGPRQLGLRPQERASNLLMIVELRIRFTDHDVGIRAGIEQQHRVDALFRSDRDTDDGGVADAVYVA